MNKSPLLILLIFLAVAAGAFLLWTSGGNRALPSLAEPRNEGAPEPAEPLDLSTVDGLGDERQTPDEDAPADLSQLGRQALPARDEQSLLIVQVWEGEPGVPAAEAEVFVVDGFDGPELGDPFAQHWSDLAQSKGLRFRTDLEGRVELPPVQEWAIVTAKLPGAYGFAKIGPEHRAVETITLQPDETVTVCVTDGKGHPAAEVPVGLLQRLPMREDWQGQMARMQRLEASVAKVRQYIAAHPGQRERAMARIQDIRKRQGRLKAAISRAKGVGKSDAKQSRKGKRAKQRQRVTSRLDLRARRRTDKAGIAVFRHFQVYRQRAAKWWPGDDLNQFEAALLVPMQQPETRPFSGQPVPSETITLRMPPTGSIALRTVDRDGRPFNHPVRAELRMQDVQTPAWTRLQDRSEADEGRIVFAEIGLGLRFSANCRLDDEDFRWNSPPFAGPIHPGERVTVDLVVAPGAGMLYGRVLDGAGEPLADIELTFLIDSRAGRLEGEEVILDTAGRFHLPYKVSREQHGPFHLEIRRNDVSPTAGLAMTLPALPTEFVTDLGDLVIDAYSEIAHGTVVDDRGEPIAGAEIQLQRERDVGDAQPELSYVDEAFAAVETDAEGLYELFGELERGHYRLRAEAPDHFPYLSPELPRDAPQDLTLQRRSRVVGTVLRPDWMSDESLRVQLAPAIEPQQRRYDGIHQNEGKDYIFFDWVRPGLYNLSLSVRNFPDPFLHIDGLEVLPGQMGLHPRLKDLDLGAYLYRFEVTAVDENGQQIAPERPLLAKIVRPDGRSGYVGVPWKSPQIEVISASPQLEVIPMANGYRAEPTSLAQGPNEVHFARIPRIELVVPGLRQLAGETRVELVMELQGDTGMPDQIETWDGLSNRISRWYATTRNARAELGDSDTVELALGHDGRYRVIANLRSSTKRIRPVPVELGEVMVELKPGTETQRITVNPDADRIQRARAELAQRER